MNETDAISCAEVPTDTVRLRCDSDTGRPFLDVRTAYETKRITVCLTRESAAKMYAALGATLEHWGST